MIIQPSLCAHSVLTISTGSFLVSGWEANDVTDRHLKSQLITKYCPGICNESRFEEILKSVLKLLQLLKIPKQRQSDNWCQCRTGNSPKRVHLKEAGDLFRKNRES